MNYFSYLCTQKTTQRIGMKLILLTCPEFFVEEDKILTTLFEEGLDILHLRKPNSEPVYCERLLSLMPEGLWCTTIFTCATSSACWAST